MMQAVSCLRVVVKGLHLGDLGHIPVEGAWVLSLRGCHVLVCEVEVMTASQGSEDETRHVPGLAPLGVPGKLLGGWGHHDFIIL